MKDHKLTVERLRDFWSSDTLEKDLKAVVRLQDPSLPVKKRIEIAESCIGNVLESARSLGKSTVGLGPTNSSRQSASIGEIAQLLATLSDTYRHLATAMTQERKKLARNRNQHLAWTLFRQLACIYESALLSSAVFTAWRPGTWKRVHNLYQLACTFGAQDIVQKHPVSSAITSNTITDLYSKLVLIGLADPYQLPSVDVYRIEKFLARRAGYVNVHLKRPAARDDDVLFCLDPETDIPAIPVTPQTSHPGLERGFVLNTIKLIYSVRARRHRLAKYPHEADKDFGPHHTEELKFLFRQLETRWSGKLNRRHQRVPKSESIEIVVSFEAIVRAIGPKTHSAEMDTFFSQMRSAWADSTEVDKFEPTEDDINVGDSLDVSSSGSRVRIKNCQGLILRVGDLVAWRESHGQSKWQLAVTRWIRETRPGQNDLGLMNIPGTPIMGMVSLAAAERPDAIIEETPSVLLLDDRRENLNFIAVMPRHQDAETIPTSLIINGEPLKVDSSKRALNTRMLQGFRMLISETHRDRLKKSIQATPRPQVRARTGQIWSSSETTSEDVFAPKPLSAVEEQT